MAIASMDQLVAGMPGQHKHFNKTTITAKAIGAWQSIYQGVGQPGQGTYPAGNSTVWTALLTGATDPGSFAFTNPGSGNSYLGRFNAVATVACTLILVDKLATCGRLLDTSTANTLTGQPTITSRAPNGEDVEIWVEWITASGATASTLTPTYTNQAGTGSKVGQALTLQTASVVGQMQQCSLAAGDTGVQSIQSVAKSASMVGTGAFNMVLLRRIAEVPLTTANLGATLDAFALGMPQIYDSSNLSFMIQCSATTALTVQGALSIIQG
jgi:hypothetical protein